MLKTDFDKDMVKIDAPFVKHKNDDKSQVWV